ncbi:hypothetical protein L1987_04220 [Smallanthus sonchifolius]|uniref:Uncharacterized protein n=1 Tax=Smallanthus sonchifolius TaxID=185202 RepID=A0ACB9KCU7_9ASTR|nr:hypothetical protein L1987_04220 [Smallanthus sonchifolius]
MAVEKELLCNLRCTIDQTLLYDQAIDHDLQVEVIVTAGGIEEDIIKCLVKGCEDVRKVVADLKSKGASAVGVAGFCWGATRAAILAKYFEQIERLKVILIMEQCVSRLDVAMFNAILREPGDEIPTDPVSDAISIVLVD